MTTHGWQYFLEWSELGTMICTCLLPITTYFFLQIIWKHGPESSEMICKFYSVFSCQILFQDFIVFSVHHSSKLVWHFLPLSPLFGSLLYINTQIWARLEKYNIQSNNLQVVQGRVSVSVYSLMLSHYTYTHLSILCTLSFYPTFFWGVVFFCDALAVSLSSHRHSCISLLSSSRFIA